MLSQFAEELYMKIHHDLLNARLLEELRIEQSFIKGFIESSKFIDSLNNMVEEKDFSCGKVLSASRDLLDSLSECTPPSDWLHYIYQFTLYKSFPDAVTIELREELDRPCSIFLRMLRTVSQYQISSHDNTWQSKYPMLFLSPQEIDELEWPGEYRSFMQAFSSDFIYELMKLSQEVMGLNTLDHVLGVHYLALYLGRQLKAKGIPVDLGRVSGAAAGHDIGKYGCRGYESKRVPYLHYYYTDQWFKKYNITYIRHIAINHSTWDLELENLPIESLLLIYSDFRVKNLYSSDKKASMHIFPLDESFDVILKKLDNVDAAKEKRYRRVYAKLRDFEEYMEHIGINIEPESKAAPVIQETQNFSLLQGSQVIQNIKYLSINHNINLMYQFRDEYSLDRILQSARSEKDWKVLREYIRVFEEYTTYFTQKQKLQTIRFLYEQLIHPEDDIRRHSAELLGSLIALFDEDYRKELPEDASLSTPEITGAQLLDEYLHLFLFPGHKIIPAHRAWIGYSTSIMVSSVFSHCSIRMSGEYKKILLKYYEKDNYKTNETRLYLLNIARFIPVSPTDKELHPLFQFVLKMLKKQNISIRLSALETSLSYLKYLGQDSEFIDGLKSYFDCKNLRSSYPAENYMRLKLARKLRLGGEIIMRLEENLGRDRRLIPDLFLSNLKTATDWMVKKINVEVLLEHTLESPESNGLHTAMHFCNLLKVSAVENVRSHAGQCILSIMPYLPVDQRNDVAVELIRALEIEGNRFTEYIPKYLGQMILWLKPVELDELIDDLNEKVKQSNPQLKCLLLKTIGISIACYPEYEGRFKESKNQLNERLIKMLSVLLNGLGDFDGLTRQVAFSVYCKEVIGSKRLDLNQKNHIFRLTAKKVLTLMADDKSEVLHLLSYSAGLNHIYRFISDYIFFKGNIELHVPAKVAFFPGTFDPFTRSHKEIVKSIRDMGFEVYLAVDEFSWSKRTLPNLLRRRIIGMSIADELGIYLYPQNIPINIANARDLNTLKQTFPGSKVYLVVGSDVLLNASSYGDSNTEGSVYSFPHIIIERDTNHNEQNRRIGDIVKKISGDVIKVTLSKQLMGISSTQIRNYIDENRDISSLVDPLVQHYIYKHDLYRREPQDKMLLKASNSISIEEVRIFSHEIEDELISLFDRKRDMVAKKLYELFQKPSARVMLLRDTEQEGRILGFSAFHWIRSGNMYKEFENDGACEYIREHTTGRTIMIDGIFTDSTQRMKNLEQVLLTETLSFCLSKDYECAIYKGLLDGLTTQSLYDILKLQGFVEIPGGSDSNPLLLVDMTNPCILNLDLESIIKEPFRGNNKVRQAIMQSRKRIQEALTGLYPGELVLSFDINIQHELMIKKICEENGVPPTITTPRKLGPSMCVPYGNILDRYVIPNTVTKALHTEKLFSPDMRGFEIGPFPYYLDLEIQSKVIKSFERPVILVDDLLHKGHRIKAIDSLFKKENIEVQKIIVGILSGRGKELMDMQGRSVDSVYFLPKLRAWFNENSLYPFMGGDALWRGIYPERNLLPSINLILPYASPKFIKGASVSSVYNLSMTAIENAIDILTALENEYHTLNERSLTLSSLGEVFVSPRCPDRGRNVDYDLNLSPSHFLKNDIELLQRLEHSLSFDNEQLMKR